MEIAVLIPARDEEALVERCLRSVSNAIASLPTAVHARTILISDSSVDRTEAIAARVLTARDALLTTNAGAVGAARALAAAHAIQTARCPPQQLWLANTDADCVVPPHWLRDQLALANQGMEAVAGIVTVDSFEEHEPQVPARFRDTYLIRSDGTHPHVHGANLGVRADRYLTAGGWADLPTAEDHDLWRRLHQTGARTCSSAKIVVATSGRRIGRAPQGFAGALAAHNLEARI